MRLRTKLEIVAACAVVPGALELFSADRTFAWLARVPAGGEAVAPSLLAFHVDRILHRGHGFWRHSCLRRAAVLALLLRRSGHDARVVIGVRRGDAGALEAHAWIACDGSEPFLEPADSISTFQPLSRA
ncbi:MAG TPA: lasso peptide biosynthesis B2 protein [Gemmatimonadaceae bacterium]|nr:lasso peptide biosynthesis B2 protein [Gemmatimonadaceae bacterium]